METASIIASARVSKRGSTTPSSFAVSSSAVVNAIARAASRITLTTTATVLSVLDPVRVYQDFATLDLVSHGRTEIIAGRSAHPPSATDHPRRTHPVVEIALWVVSGLLAAAYLPRRRLLAPPPL